MKLSLLLIIGAMAASSFSLQARPATKPNQDVFRAEQSTTELIGLEVRNFENVRLGSIKFITVDLLNARLVEVVVIRSGGFLGFGGNCTSVPPRAFTLDAANNVVRVNISAAKFKAAPRFSTSDVPSYSDRLRIAAVNRYYGLEPWFFQQGQQVRHNAQILELGYVHTTGFIQGLQIKNRQGQYLGKVSGLQMDMPKGQIIHVVTEMNAMGGAKNAVIQARAFQFNGSHNGLVLDETRAQFAAQPQMKWNGAGQRNFQQESYVNREVQADKGLHSRQSAQEGMVRSATPMAQGLNFRDEQKSSLILQRIQADPRLSPHAKNIEVVTLNGQTTLRGHVDSVEGKRRIGQIAAEGGRAENVSNLIEVKPHRN